MLRLHGEESHAQIEGKGFSGRGHVNAKALRTERSISQVWKDKIEGQKPQLLGTGINTAEPSLSPEARILI